MADASTIALKQVTWVWQGGSLIKTEIDVLGIGRDVDKSLLQILGEGICNRECVISVIDELIGLGCQLQNLGPGGEIGTNHFRWESRQEFIKFVWNFSSHVEVSPGCG